MVTATLPKPATTPSDGRSLQPESRSLPPEATFGKSNAVSVASGRSDLPLKEIDACGLQCPGPIMRLANELATLAPGQSLAITSTDPGFAADIPAWCKSTGNRLIEVVPHNGHFRATIARGEGSSMAVSAASCPSSSPMAALPGGKKKTMVVFQRRLRPRPSPPSSSPMARPRWGAR